MKKKKYSFALRTAAAYFVVAVLFFICGARIIAINLKGYSAVAAAQGQYKLSIYRHRGTIFDRNMDPITNVPGQVTAAVVATPQSLTALGNTLPRGEFEAAVQRLNSGRPILLQLDKKIVAGGITLFDTYQRYSGLAPHIIGYLDSEGHGKAGIEAAWDSLLYSNVSTEIIYNCDALGQALAGVAPTVANTQNSAVKNGVMLTLDNGIQRIVQEETADMGSGAAVVLEVATGNVLAMHSFPAFDPEDPAADLGRTDSPFLNRALCNYNAGSVFKSCVAAAAIENGTDIGTTFTCTGSIDVAGVNFVCNKSGGHGEMDLKSALAHSCNVYFYELALSLPREVLCSAAQKMGFAAGIDLANGIVSDSPTLPSEATLTLSPAAVANFAIGQGEVMVSPINLAAAYATIAADGIFRTPTLIAGVVNNGTVTPTVSAHGERVISETTCATLKEALITAVAEGTGTAATLKYCSSAGKTATAQTGWLKDGRQVIISWFAGFFPAESPKYVIVIMKEDGKSGSSDCAPIFKSIADRIYLLP